MPFDHIDLPVIGRAAEVRADSIDAEARTIEIVWTTGAVVQRRRWEGWDDLVEYDEELIVSANAIRLERLNDGAPFLNSHSSWDLTSVLGTVVPGSVRIEGGKGYATIRLTSAPDAADAVHRIMERTVNKVSVGYRVHAYEIEKRDGQREIWRAVDWEPYEISAVAMPADAGAQIRSDPTVQRRNACVVTRRDTNPAASAAQPEGQTMPPEDTPQGAGGIDTRTATPPVQDHQPAQPTADQIRTEERQRTSTITSLCERHGMTPEFRQGLIDNGTSLDAARSAILDQVADRDSTAARSTTPPPAQVQGEGDANYRSAMELAIRHQLNPGSVELTAGAREFRGMRMLDMARDVLERGGVRTRGMSGMELAGAALNVRSAGVGYHTTSDFPIILGNVLNQTLRDAYATSPRTFQPWARRATISDFRPVTRAQLGGAPDLLKVPEGAEFKYGTMGEGKEAYALTTYGRIMAVTRQVIVNNEFDMIARIASAFGAAAADLESDLVYSILMQNPAMADGKALFHVDHGNLAGSASVISETALGSAYRSFGQQKGIEKRPISILPRYILVPPGQRSIEARKAIAATTPNSTSDVNTFAGRLEVVEEPRLIPATGQDPWFLTADPARIDTIEYAYLDGQEGVYTETRTGFEVDGVEVKARHDFAAKAIDWRGLWKNAGAAAA